MITLIHLSQDAFRRMVQIQILKQFQPIDLPVSVPQPLLNPTTTVPCYMDGLEITPPPNFGQSGATRGFVLNSAGATISLAEPQFQTNPLPFFPMQMQLSLILMMASVAAVQSAGVVHPVPGDLDPIPYPFPHRDPSLAIPLDGAVFDIYLSVDSSGVPTLNFSVTAPPIGINVSPQAQSFFNSFAGGLSIPFPVASAFKDLLPPGMNRVVNAGLVYTGNVVMRFEFEPVATGAATDSVRLNQWSEFFAGHVSDALGTKDWAIEFPGQTLADSAAILLDQKISSSKDVGKWFTKTQEVYGEFQGSDPPVIKFVANGVFQSLCGGLDIQGSLDAYTNLSVPVANTVRAFTSIEINMDAWDEFKCTLLSILNPLSGVITAFDKGLDWYWAPVAQALQTLAPLARGLDADDLVTTQILKQVQDDLASSGGPTIIRVDPSEFYVDVKYSISTSLTQNWLEIDGVSSDGENLVIGGAFTAPDVTTSPRLRGTLEDWFRSWSRPKCSQGSWTTMANIALTVEGNDAQIPILYGIHMQELVFGRSKDGLTRVLVPAGQITWRIVDDPAVIYRGRYTLTHWTGIPG